MATQFILIDRDTPYKDTDVSKELKQRQDRLAVIIKAKQEIQTRAKARYAQTQINRRNRGQYH